MSSKTIRILIIEDVMNRPGFGGSSSFDDVAKADLVINIVREGGNTTASVIKTRYSTPMDLSALTEELAFAYNRGLI